MYLYDTATRKVRTLEATQGRVAMYVCGITPYDSAHLGHAFTYHTFDLVTRRLRALGNEVVSVRNVTDVDDDLLRVSRERGVDYLVLANGEVSRFNELMASLNILPVTHAPRATQAVPAIVDWVQDLIAADAAYVVDGWVFFAVETFPAYGELSGLNVEAMIALSRERGANPDDLRKRDPLDFVLWQPSASDEPHWPSPWSAGRPGWHIECTVMANTEAGLPIDLHGGGDDLIYPHHDSEIAQAESLGNVPFARHWMHVAMVHLAGTKMSKSLGNLVFVHDLVERAGGPTVRLLLADHHYRSSWEYDEAELSKAGTRETAYRAALQSSGSLEHQESADFQEAFWERIDDDLDSAGALAVLDLAASAVSSQVRQSNAGRASAVDVLTPMLDGLGVDLAAVAQYASRVE